MRRSESIALATIVAMLGACAPVEPPRAGRGVSPQSSGPASRSVEKPASVEGAAFAAAHNRWRREVGAPDIAWSRTLEQRARRQAAALQNAGCRLAHEEDELGENLFLRWTRPHPPQATPEQVVESWAREHTDYNEATNRCRPGKGCGHYTQVVWAETRAVGCASARCVAPDDRHILIWVCKYEPRGNYAGERPY